MDRAQLLERISKKEESIAKINRRIDKWKKQCPEGHIEIAEQFRHSTYSEFARYCKEHNIPHSFTPIDELRRAYQDLDESEVTLNKYKNQLELVESRESQEKIPVLVEFFKRYKNEVTKYIEFNMPTLIEYYQVNKEYCEWHNHRNSIMREERLTEDEWKRRLYQLREREEELKSYIHPITFSVYAKRFDDCINREELDKILDKDIEAKYYNMVERVTKITGEIIDADHIDIGNDGNLNGIIKGKNGNAKLETIGAGGYNQNVIVNVRRGQIFHYRLIVHEVK